jgi:REP element-mobilizing transposase RayT
LGFGVAHPYTPYCQSFSYIGRYWYALTVITFGRLKAFTAHQSVKLVRSQFERAADEKKFEILVDCYMPDHLHMVVGGLADDSDFKAFVKLAKQYSGYCYAQMHGREKLWHKGAYDHIIRDDVDLLDRIRYIVNNPVAAGLVARAEDYPFLGSQRWKLSELIAWCKRNEPPA